MSSNNPKAKAPVVSTREWTKQELVSHCLNCTIASAMCTAFRAPCCPSKVGMLVKEVVRTTALLTDAVEREKFWESLPQGLWELSFPYLNVVS